MLANEPRLMPHIHLSMQAGDDLTLKRMKRRHSRSDAIRFCAQIRALRPDVAFGADLIAGFPTETEAMFQKTLDIVDECGLSFLHVFPFSPRRGTPAARMPQNEKSVIKDRAARLRQKGDDVLEAFLTARIGSEAQVLVERVGLGRTEQFAEMQLDTGGRSEGAIVKARVTGQAERRLQGEVIA